MLKLWSKSIIWLYGGFKGVPDLKSAWLIGSPVVYLGVIVWIGAFPVSGKAWAIFGLTLVYAVLFYIPLADGHLSPLAYILLVLPGALVSLRILAAKTHWTTPEKVRELAGWRKWPRR
jgi:hypothetical protein